MPIDTTSWIAWLVLLPLGGAAAALLAPRRAAAGVGAITALGLMPLVAGVVWQVAESGAQRYAVGGWGAPLGIDLYADGLSILMVAMVAAVGLAVSVYALAYFRAAPEKADAFWPLWLLMWAALNALFLAGDIFNLYVTLELVGLSAVALVALAGTPEALAGAMRYLLLSLLGSLLYLLGVALLYQAYATVDIASLGRLLSPGPPAWVGVALMSTGLVLKTALFPLHFWLPPAHASAPAPVSALLSALVVKASFYLLLRLWLDVFGALTPAVGTVLGVLGAVAVIWGSIQALRQVRLKLLVAYSTVAQLGYLFLAFPLAAGAAAIAWSGAVYFALAHALAKAAMFLAAGNILQFGGHDRIVGLDRVAQRLPLSLGAFALAGVSIMGLPPSGGFVAKWLLLEAALLGGQWGWVLVIITGSLLAAAYVFKVVGHAFTQAQAPHESRAVPPVMEWAALVLALGSLLLGLIASQALPLMQAGEALVPMIPGAVP